MSADLVQRRRQLEAARTTFARRQPGPVELAPEVSDSWRRCAARLPVDHTAPVNLDDPDASWSESPIRRAAPDIVEELGRLATGEDYIAAVTDGTGHIIWSAAGRSMARLAEQVNFVRGASWDESAAGTNAPGLALHTGKPATVFATEHWCEAVQDWVCYAAPIRAPSGLLVGVLDLSTIWRRASPLALTTVTAMARLVEQQLLSSPATAPVELRLEVLGHPSAALQGQPLRLSQRQFEILVILAARQKATFEELHDLLYGDRPVTRATLKAEISHLRQLLGGAIESRPYRLTLSVEADVLDTLQAVRHGDLEGALRRYAGQLLPNSESPFIIELRHHLDVSVRAAVLQHGQPGQLLHYADVHPFDVEVLEAARLLAPLGDPLLGEVTARLDRASR